MPILFLRWLKFSQDIVRKRTTDLRKEIKRLNIREFNVLNFEVTEWNLCLS